MIMKMLTFRNVLLCHEGCVSGMSFVSFKIDFELSLQNNKNLEFLWENICLPCMRFLLTPHSPIVPRIVPIQKCF